MTRGKKGSTPKCKTAGCEILAKLRGYCIKHGQRVIRTGSDAPGVRPRWSLEKFFSQFHLASTGCVEWTGHVQRNGYGYVRIGKGHARRVHKFAWEMFKGKVPEGLVVRHLCHNKICCNLDHLAIGTQKENIQDSVRAGRFCRKSAA